MRQSSAAAYAYLLSLSAPASGQERAEDVRNMAPPGSPKLPGTAVFLCRAHVAAAIFDTITDFGTLGPRCCALCVAGDSPVFFRVAASLLS